MSAKDFTWVRRRNKIKQYIKIECPKNSKALSALWSRNLILAKKVFCGVIYHCYCRPIYRNHHCHSNSCHHHHQHHQYHLQAHLFHILQQGLRIIGGRLHKLSLNFEENFSRVQRNFEQQNKVLQPSYLLLITALSSLLLIMFIYLMHSVIVLF